MKVMIWLQIFVLAVLFHQGAWSCSYAMELSLGEAMKIALDKSPFLGSRLEDFHAAKEGVGVARGGLLPKIDAIATYGRTSDPQVVVPIKSFKGTPPTFSRDLYHIGITLRMPIYEGGRLRTRLKMAEIEAKLNEEALMLGREEVAYLVRSVFYRLLYLDGVKKAQEKTLTALRRVKKDAEARCRVGRLRPVDLMRIDAQLKQEEAMLVQTIQEKRRGQHLFARLLGLAEGRELVPVGKLGSLPSSRYQVTEGQLAELIKDRPEIRRAIHEVRLKKEAVSLEKGLKYPSISLSTDYGRRAGSGFEGDEELWQVGIDIGINLFSGGLIKHRVSKAMHEYMSAREQLRELELKAIQDVKDALSRIREATAKIRAQEQSLEASRESFRTEKLRYEAGAGTVTDVLFSEAQWLNAEAGLLQGYYELELGKADLDRALGRTIAMFEKGVF